MRRPFFGEISSELISAKKTLRERLLPSIEESLPKVFVVRRAERYSPAPGVNLVGLGVGEKVTGGRRTGEMCVKVLVARKYPKGRISRSDLIPATIAGIPTDIEGVGYPRKFQLPRRQRRRPVPGGVSVSLDLHAVSYRFAGTLGLIVADRGSARALYALSNNHVLADENRATIGAGVVQPATLDGGGNADRVARLAQFEPLRFGNRRNWMDAAVAAFLPRVGVDRTILEIGPLTGPGDPSLNLLVRKSGRTTGLTEGIVRAVRFDVFNVQYDRGMVRIDDVLVIEGVSGAFSRAGDSGSAIVDHQGKAIGLLFAGSDQVTFAIPIRRVLRRFHVRVAT